MNYDVRIESSVLSKLQHDLSETLSENVQLKHEVKYLRLKLGYPEYLPGDTRDMFRRKYEDTRVSP